MSHVTEQIDAHLAGGLTAGEKVAFERHIASCQECAAMVEAARLLDTDLRDLFADVRPSADFEDRMAGSLEYSQQQMPARVIRDSGLPARFNPLTFFGLMSGLAATVMVGSVAVSIAGHKTSAMIGTLAAILPGNEPADAGPLASGSLIETSNSSGTVEINPAAAENTANADRLDYNTGLIASDGASVTSGLAVSPDSQT